MYNMAKVLEILIPTVIGIGGIGLAVYYTKKNNSLPKMSSHSLTTNLGYSKYPTVSHMGLSDPELLDTSERGSSFSGSERGSSEYYSAQEDSEEEPPTGGRNKKTKRKQSKKKTKRKK
jgi:hypothetical protein